MAERIRQSVAETVTPNNDSKATLWEAQVTQWEYDVEIGKFEQLNELIRQLNEAGNEGWEAVGFTGDNAGENFTVLLKRAKRDEVSGGPTWGR